MNILLRPVFCFILLLLVSFLGEAASAEPESDHVYIVYMGAASDGAPRDDHTQLMASLMKQRKKNALVQSYSHGFSGIAARLSEEEAKSISRRPGVVSVFQDTVLQLHTTRSWDFLQYQNAVKIDSLPTSPDAASTGADIIIGILDTGIWPESQSFTDEGMRPVPSRWKGKCIEGQNFTSSNCNRKVIGARYYSSDSTPRDEMGHGTHVASTAAGMPVSAASYYDLAKGTARGGASSSRIAMYRVCNSRGRCASSSILKGFDDAIADGVDLISVSLGSSAGELNFYSDPIAIGAFHAVEKGIMVICSAGNSGPAAQTVVNAAPWIMTVAATTIDRDLQTNVLLGGNKIIQGGGINFSKLDKSPVYPLIDGNSARALSTLPDNGDARDCIPGALDETKVKGKVVLCENNNEAIQPINKFRSLQNSGSVGMIIIDEKLRQVPQKYGYSPVSAVTTKDGAEIQSYINSSSDPVATILPTVTVANYKPAPVVGWFSSKGPVRKLDNLLKPDVAAPGVSILAAWPSNDRAEGLPDKEPPLFNILSGTSMACPHVSALAANVKSHHPTWSPSAIRSAIMTTAIQKANNTPITTITGTAASPYEMGAGEISLSEPLQPGLIYETDTAAYIQFLCNIGYGADKIRIISGSVADNFSCPVNANSDIISQMNYPSIAISNMKENDTKTVTRRVTNVGEEDSTYIAAIEAPEGVQVTVDPSILKFAKGSETQSFQLKFTLLKTTEEHLFGSITWSAAMHQVRSPFVLRSASTN